MSPHAPENLTVLHLCNITLEIIPNNKQNILGGFSIGFGRF